MPDNLSVSSFKRDLETLINRYSMESGSNTPDFILAEYLCQCLTAWDTAMTKRTKWNEPSEKE